MPKVAFKTLGCRLNQAETDLIAEDLMRLGFDVVGESDSPDVVIVNTCTVTQEATRGSRKTATRAAEVNPEALVVVAGCYAVAEANEARGLAGVGLVATNEDKEHLAKMIADRLGIAPATASRPVIQLGKPSGFPGADRTRVNLKVQTGCDEWCSFCIIPTTRGDLHSYDLNELLERARRKADEGTKELVLTGVHLGKYGWDDARPDDALVELLECLLQIDGLNRIRLSSILCRHLTDRVVGLIASEEKLCRFLHVPLQAGHDRILEAMNRPYRIGEYIETIEMLKERIPGLGLSTDVIVGFPTETEEEFEATMQVSQHARFLKMHVFRYSARPGTPSATMAGQVPEEIKKNRSKRLIALGNRMREEYHASQVGLVREVLVENRSDSGELAGHTDDFVMVRFDGPADA
ncbi:MAG: tRNA (N(6)-L-threonylcarbamoyladenosine(37)-C(2))-methylthiotransferase MtaB, partial [Actinobacteria bacterium]|nr:tRNA (N(6)-L-threonylcarbamoyladenosine(37)-C(2))-methylthiotransferase MtaB [Actinomycetota bacterium]